MKYKIKPKNDKVYWQFELRGKKEKYSSLWIECRSGLIKDERDFRYSSNGQIYVCRKKEYNSHI